MVRVKELMTGLSEIPIVDENATLFEAVLEIGLARTKMSAGMRSPAALVVDGGKRVSGFLEFKNMLMGLDAGFEELIQSARQSGLSPDRVRSELQKSGLLQDALDGLCQKAGETSIKSVMTIPGQDRTTDGDVSISEAAYRMVESGQDYLLVLEGNVVEGIISLSDVMGYICDTVRACRL
ncbi:MAG: CBS domain-containing protein [Syntrophobacteraceae bacterium]|nr:CBS domain-containing protein [Syntrophobacteraceae bacterium]